MWNQNTTDWSLALYVAINEVPQKLSKAWNQPHHSKALHFQSRRDDLRGKTETQERRRRRQIVPKCSLEMHSSWSLRLLAAWWIFPVYLLEDTEGERKLVHWYFNKKFQFLILSVQLIFSTRNEWTLDSELLLNPIFWFHFSARSSSTGNFFVSETRNPND